MATLKQYLALGHVSSVDAEMILEDPTSYRLRRSVGGSVRVQDLIGGSVEWHYRGVRVWYDDSVTYSRYTTGGYRRGRSYETLRDAIAGIDAQKAAKKVAE